MRLSKFWKHIIFIILTVLVTYIGIVTKDLSDNTNYKFVTWTIFIISGFSIFMYILTYFSDLYELTNMKYRIRKRRLGYSDRFFNYKAEVYRLVFLFIPKWVSIDSKYHSLKSKNFFGQKQYDGYYTDTTYDDKESALLIINKEKESVSEKRKKFFSRPTIIKNEIIIIK